MPVRALFEESASLLRPLLPLAVDLIIEDVASDIAISGEPAQLQQIILNLCSNAAHAIAGNGCIRVTAQQMDEASPVSLSHGSSRLAATCVWQ